MKRKYLFLVLCAISAVSVSFSQLSVPFERFTLPNGLEVIMHEDHSIPVATCNIWYHVGSSREKSGRTGLAHLFEHLMFEGSKNVPEGKFDEWLEAAGGDNNASTNQDRTNYYQNFPTNAMELAFFLDSDRMGYLTNAMTPAVVDGQRSVVKNERRQSYENRPYGMASIIISENLFPPGHPYSWPVIGSQEDLSAATYEDVVEFFRKYYAPNNASLVVAGDIDPVKTKQLVTKWFAEVPAGEPVPPLSMPSAYIKETKRLIHEDKVQLPRIYMNWLTPRQFAPGDAEMDILSDILSGGKNSRLYKRLIYDLQIAQDVTAYQASGDLISTFSIIITARSGISLGEIERIVWEELNKIKKEQPSEREVERAVNQYEAQFLGRLERIGGFGGKADLLNAYFTRTGNPDYFNEDLGRYKMVSPTDVQSMMNTYIRPDNAVILSVIPLGKKELASPQQ